LEDLEGIFKALADKNRLRILKLLEKKAMCVCELAFVLEIAQPSVSRHLKKLRVAGLIEDRQAGFWSDYILAAAPRGGRGYAGSLVGLLRNWLNDDRQVFQDRARARRADRNVLCRSAAAGSS
jgi:ArsR family transcriptional regulator